MWAALALGVWDCSVFSCLFTNQKGKLYISSSSKSDCRAEIKIRRGKSSEKCLLFQFSPSCWLLTGKQLLLCFPFLLGGSCPARVLGLEHRGPNGTEHVPRPHRLPWASTHRDLHSQVGPGAASRLFFFFCSVTEFITVTDKLMNKLIINVNENLIHLLFKRCNNFDSSVCRALCRCTVKAECGKLKIERDKTKLTTWEAAYKYLQCLL